MNRSIIDAIGNTPLVEIRRLNPNLRVKIFAKLESFNPGGSVKDRPALYMIEAGEQKGLLTPKKTVVEATSGNTGIGLALVCAVKGYRLLLAMSEAVSEERRKILKARGADILLTPGHLGTDGAIEEVYRLVRENPDLYFMPDQFNNAANWRAHYHGTAEEIWRQTGGRVTAVVATLGTSGTLMGISRRLKEYHPDVRIIGVEPFLGHKIQGLKNMKEAYQPEIFEKQRLDKKINIEDEEAFEMTRRLALEEGIFAGMSSGAAMAIAVKETAAMEEGVMVVILPDGGERYLSTTVFAVKEKVALTLFNTMTRKKEIFKPLVPGKASVYTCGPTAHARMQIGECRRFVFSDLLCRYLEYRGYTVRHVMNITDFDDKTLAGSESADVPLSEFSRKNIEGVQQDLETLGVRPADAYPLSSGNLQDMVQIARNLKTNGYAYEKLRSLYFNIARIPDYGKLSGIDLQKIRLGATVDLDEYEKDNPRDFTLLKRSRLSELKRGIFVKTEWGNVRPSWHLQCTAAAVKTMGERYDIHASGRELIFPHHENHLAISVALTGHPMANYWVHCERVLWEAAEREKNKGGPLLAALFEKGYPGRVIRYWILSHHYRKPLTFSEDRLEEAGRALKRIDACTDALRQVREGTPDPETDQLLYDIKHGFISAMDDDLNMPEALAAVFDKIRKVNVGIRRKTIDAESARKILNAFLEIDAVLNIFQRSDQSLGPEAAALMKEREAARKARDWDTADRLRDRLRSMGIDVRDTPV